MSLGMALCLSVPLGLYAARHAHSKIDKALRYVFVVLASVPDFVFAFILVSVFALTLHLLPARGYVEFFENPLESLRYTLLPTSAMAIFYSGLLIRFVRAAALEVALKDCIRTARGKGLSEYTVQVRHILRLTLIPLVSMLGSVMLQILGGVIVQEEIFGIPGMGKLVLQAFLSRDYPVLQTVVLCSGVLAIALNLVIDLSYGLIDPRIRYA
jgi:peptide/nickel transport system permease protein